MQKLYSYLLRFKEEFNIMSTTSKETKTTAAKATKAAETKATKATTATKAAETKTATAAEAKSTETKATAKKTTAKKATTTKATTAKKTTSKKAADIKTTVAVEFNGKQVFADSIIEDVKNAWVDKFNGKLSDIKTVDLYVNTYENKAYYVINGTSNDEYFIQL